MATFGQPSPRRERSTWSWCRGSPFPERNHRRRRASHAYLRTDAPLTGRSSPLKSGGVRCGIPETITKLVVRFDGSAIRECGASPIDLEAVQGLHMQSVPKLPARRAPETGL
jgi:hypothetical protein